MVFSKLAFSASRVACQPSRTVSSRHSPTTSPRWLKKARSSSEPERGSKSDSRAITGCRSAAGSRFKGVSGCSLASHAAQAADHALSVGRRREAGGGHVLARGLALEAAAVVAALQHIAGLAEQGDRVVGKLNARTDGHGQAGLHALPACAAVDGAIGMAAQAVRNEGAAACRQQAE